MKHNRVNNCDFLSILYSELLREYKNVGVQSENALSFPSLIYSCEMVINNNLLTEIFKKMPLLLKNLQNSLTITKKEKLHKEFLKLKRGSFQRS